VSDQLRADNLTNEGLKVGGNGLHALSQILSQRLSESDQFSDALSPLFDLNGIVVVHVHTHGNLVGIDKLLSLFFIKHDGSNFFLVFIGAVVSLSFEKVDQTGIDTVIVDDFGHLGEMPREPFLQPHRKGVDILVHLLDEGDRLRNWLIVSVHVFGADKARVRVSQTQLGLLNIILINLLDHLCEVHANSAQQLGRSLVVARSDSCFAKNFLTQFGVANSKGKLLFLGRFGGWQFSGQELTQKG